MADGARLGVGLASVGGVKKLQKVIRYEVLAVAKSTETARELHEPYTRTIGDSGNLSIQEVYTGR